MDKIFPELSDLSQDDDDKEEILHLSIDVQRYLQPRRPFDLNLLNEQLALAQRYASGHVMELFPKKA